MLLGSRNLNLLLLALTTLIILFSFSCDRKTGYPGVYLEQGEQPPENSETYIELKEDGQGVWRVLDDEASFRWDVKDSEIRLHTKLGGVVIGTIQKDTIEIALPGQKIKYFKKRSNI